MEYTLSLPSILSDSLLRQQNLILLCGQRHSGVENIIEKISDEIKKKNLTYKGAFISKNKVISNNNFWNVVNYDELLLNPDTISFDTNQIIIFENITRMIEFEAAIELVEEGRNLIMHFSCPGVLNALHRIFGFYTNENRYHFLWRFLDVCTLMYSQIQFKGEKGDWCSAGEVIPLNTDLKKILLTQGIHPFEEKIKSEKEESGIVTLNQSLLQLLIRRKITVQKSFELSRDPVDLDQLLKKVGI